MHLFLQRVIGEKVNYPFCRFAFMVLINACQGLCPVISAPYQL